MRVNIVDTCLTATISFKTEPTDVSYAITKASQLSAAFEAEDTTSINSGYENVCGMFIYSVVETEAQNYCGFPGASNDSIQMAV